MEIAKQNINGVMTVSLSGRLDAASSMEAEEELGKVIDENKKLILNLSGLEYISSAGLRVLLVSAKRIRREGGKMCLCELKENVLEVFEISGFSAIFDLEDTAKEALGFINS